MTNRRDTASMPALTTGDSERSAASIVDLDVLRGWSEDHDPALQKPHHLPALATLEELGSRGEVLRRFPIHGPEVLLGRFQPRYAPMDRYFATVLDHQAYRLGAPHAHLSLHDGVWSLQALSPQKSTAIEGDELLHLNAPCDLKDGQILSFGVVRFVFRSLQTNLKQWRQCRRELLDQLSGPALLLKRHGGICGPYHLLGDAPKTLVGRGAPAPGVLPGTQGWTQKNDGPLWDLSGIYDHERRHLGFRHARIARDGQRWTLKPLAPRQRTFINRIAISGEVPLSSGDEIGLGSVLIYFYDPSKGAPSRESRPVPAVVDWSEGRSPKIPGGGTK